MRHRRLLVVLAITAGLWAPRDAGAVCGGGGPYLGTGPQLPLGCPLHVYTALDPSTEPPLRRVTVLRDGAYVAATGAITTELTQFFVKRTFVDCQLQPIRVEDSPEPYEHAAIVPAGVAVGERIGLGSGWFGGIEIVAAGPCAAPIPPTPACTEVPLCSRPPPFESFESNGCAAGGGGSLAGGLALLGLIARRRRRR